jgi:hypothetical protein
MPDIVGARPVACNPQEASCTSCTAPEVLGPGPGQGAGLRHLACPPCVDIFCRQGGIA